MINHFKTFLLKRSQEFFTKSLFRTYTCPWFVPSTHTQFTAQIDSILFGADADASLCDYRYFEFLRLIKSCGLTGHTTRFDVRKTYCLEKVNLAEPSLFVSSTTSPILLAALPESLPKVDLPLRKVLHLSGTPTRLTITDKETRRPVAFRVLEKDGIALSGLDTAVRNIPDVVDHTLDIRNPPKRTSADIIEAVLSLPQSVYFGLFVPLRTAYPEYEEGFRRVNDTVHKFCMILFAQAITLQRQSQHSHVE